MERIEILSIVEDIFRSILDDSDIILKDDTTANDIEEWDSLTHIQLIVTIEKRFGIKFKSKEILSWNNVGDMLNSIELKV